MIIDRLSVRERPPGSPLLYQSWGSLLFLHWPMEPERLRPHVPAGLDIDTYDGMAWVALTPLAMWGIRPRHLPAVPLASESLELNVRTYVHHRGVPGVWFLSLDASNPLAVLGARLGFSLPYYQARMALEEHGDAVHFSSRRTHPGAPDAELTARWTRGEPLPAAEPGTREFFLIERYCLYARTGTGLSRTRIHHRPWPLREARLVELKSGMLASHGLPTPEEPPLVHAQAAPLDVEIWPPESLD